MLKRMLKRNKISYVMETGHDCGFRAQLFSLQDYNISEEKLRKIRHWKDHNDIRDDLMDSHWHHFMALERLNIPYEIISPDILIRGFGSKNKTNILIHNKLSPFLMQHWIVFKSISNHKINVHYGNGQTKSFNFDEFEKLVMNCWPNIIYTIGKGDSKLSWFPKLYVKITEWLFG